MPAITTTVLTDEKTWQGEFYKALYGEDYTNYVSIDRSTDGYTDGILFEHKTNLQNAGLNKPLSQAIIYLTRFNRDGVPVPAKICLVGQEDEKCYIYDTEKYMDFINNIPKYANLKASDGIAGFKAGKPSEIIKFDMKNPVKGMRDISDFVENPAQYVQVTINKHNVYGWATYYYDHAVDYKQKPEKKAFFNELKKPIGTLESYIKPWDGKESDFKYIMDILNDPETQKDLGAFYTPPAYVKKAVEFVKQAIKRVPEGNDYVIIDRCAGTGNLEMYLDDDILRHVIISTYELKEWIVLKDRYDGRVLYIIPPVPENPEELPDLNESGFLSGANALTRDIIDNPVVRKYLDNNKCTVILYENPPFVENTQVVKSDGKTIIQKKTSTWKKSDMAVEMASEIDGVALNDMGNVFIWSGFKHFLRQPNDSYIVFSPIKYWKAHHLISKKFIDGCAFNRKHFHADATCVTCIFWSNEDDKMTHNFDIRAYDIENENLIDEGIINVKQVFSTFSDNYFDSRVDDTDTKDGIVCEIDGTLSNKEPLGLIPLSNDNIIGYLVAYKNTFDSPRYCSMLLRGGIYNGHGFYLRSDNFIEKLPMFAASRYTDNNNGWKIMSMVMKSGDKAEQYHADIRKGKLDKFLCQTLIWTGLTHYAHMRSLDSKHLNELCFDNLDGKTTLAFNKLNEYISAGYELETEKILFEKWNDILSYIHDNCEEYNPKFKYGLYQIDEEINIKIQQGTDSKGNPKMIQKYGDLNDYIKDLKTLLRQYYLDNLVDTLFEYEFLK